MTIFLLVLAYIIGATELWLAVYFWRTNAGQEIRKVIAFLCLMTSAWVVITTTSMWLMPSYSNGNPTLTLRLIFVAGVFMLTALLHLVILYPQKRFAFDRLHTTFLYVPAAFFALLALLTSEIAKSDISATPFDDRVIVGPLYVWYNAFLLLCFIGSLSLLWWKHRYYVGVQKNAILLIFWALLLGGLPGMLVDVILPFWGVQTQLITGPISTVVWLLATMWVVFWRGIHKPIRGSFGNE